MSFYIFDTDHFSLYQRGHQGIEGLLKLVDPDDVAITIITVEEQVRGRLAQVGKAKSAQARVVAQLRH